MPPILDGWRTRFTVYAAVALLVPVTATAQQDAAVAAVRRVLATSELAVKEYAQGVVGRTIVSREEVVEALLFLDEARSTAIELPAAVSASATALIDSMIASVETTENPETVAAIAAQLSAVLSDAFGDIEEVAPSLRPSLVEGARIYAEACVACHGAEGRGDGRRADSLTPRPSDFTDSANLADQSPLDFFRKIGIGVAGTDMPSFDSSAFTPSEQWAVAWYVTRFRASAKRVDEGAAILARYCDDCERSVAISALAVLPPELADPSVTARHTDEELAAMLRDGSLGPGKHLDEADAIRVVAYLRTLPFAEADGPGAAAVFGGVRTELARAMRKVKDGEEDAAAMKAFDAYASFEAVETELKLRDAGLVSELEADFGAFRGRIQRGDDMTALGEPYGVLLARLGEAERLLDDRSSTAGLFAQSFVLLLREGIEALLIVGALVTLVVRAGAGHRKREIWWGVGVGIAASLVTAVMLETVFILGVAQQEALEGITMLVATVVLIVVSYWLISKVEVQRWKAFVESQATRALSGGSMLTLGLAAFLAVYREGFETVLFYKALVISAEGNGAAAILGGGAAGAAVLVAVYWGIRSFGLRIPLRPFFALTSAALLYMAFSFAGKGIAELQGSRLVSITFIDWVPRLPWAGIYPTAQSLALQGMVLLLVGGGVLWTFVLQPRLQSPES